MAYVIADRIAETSTSTGLTNIVLAGAISKYRRFQDGIAVDGGTTTFPYVIEHQGLNEWEVGISYLDTSTQIKRGGTQTVLFSSNANAAVNFSAGTKNAFISAPAAWMTDLAKTNVPQSYSKQQYIAQTTLTDATNIAWNLDNAMVAKVTLGGNRTLSAPSNMKAGATYILHVYQDGAGNRTLAFDTVYKWPNNTPPTITVTAGYHDVLAFICDGTYMFGAYQQGYTV